MPRPWRTCERCGRQGVLDFICRRDGSVVCASLKACTLRRAKGS